MSLDSTTNKMVENHQILRWIARDDSPPTVLRQRIFFLRKHDLASFFKSIVPVFIHYVERKQTVNHQYYID